MSAGPITYYDLRGLSGLRPEINSADAFQQRLAANLWLTNSESSKFFNIPSRDRCAGLHRDYFNGIFAWAGTKRNQGEPVVLEGGPMGCPPTRLDREFDMLEAQTRAIMGSTGDEYKAAAFACARLWNMKPFRFGNLVASLGTGWSMVCKEQRFFLGDRAAFADSLETTKTGNLGPLVDFLRQAAGVEPKNQDYYPEFRITNGRDTPKKVSEEISISRMEAPRPGIQDIPIPQGDESERDGRQDRGINR